MISIHDKVLKNIFETPDVFEARKSLVETLKLHGNTKPEHGWCFINSLVEIDRNGGELVFGSLGFLTRRIDK